MNATDPYAKFLQPDYGDSFSTGEEVVALLKAGQFYDAELRIASCIRLHRMCGNWHKANIIQALLTAIKDLRYRAACGSRT